MQLQRQVRPACEREREAFEVCLHKELTPSNLVTLMLACVVFGAFVSGMFAYSAGYDRAYDQGYAGETRVQNAYEAGKAACDL